MPLDQATFEKEILNQFWFQQDSLDAENESGVGMTITSDTFVMVEIAWLEGIFELRKGYEVKVENDFFELRLLEVVKDQTLRFVYGFLDEDKNLWLNLSETQWDLGGKMKLLDLEEWIQFKVWEEDGDSE